REYLEGLTGELDHLSSESGHISAWSSQASCKSGLYRIVSPGHDDRNGHGGVMCGTRRCGAVGQNDIDPRGHQRLGQFRQSIQLSIAPNGYQGESLSFMGAVVGETAPQGCHGVLGRCRGAEKTDARRLSSLLRARCERPRGCRAAEQRDEFAAPDTSFHLIPAAGRATE